MNHNEVPGQEPGTKPSLDEETPRYCSERKYTSIRSIMDARLRALGQVRTPRVKFGRAMLSILIMSAIGFALLQACDMVFHPWAYPLGGRRPLTGLWIGRFESQPGRIISINLDRLRDSSGNLAECDTCPELEGWLRFCEAGAVSSSYRISGRVSFWRGSPVSLWFDSLGPDFANEEMPATWDHANSLTLMIRGRATPHVIDPPAATHVVTLHPASNAEFLSACSRSEVR